MEKFQENIKKWVALDTQLKTLNEHSKNIRNEKNTLNENIMGFVETNNLSQSTVKITDGKFIYNGGIWDKTVGEMGPSVLVSIGNIQILLSSYGTYEWNCEQFLSFDLELDSYKFLVVKNPMNYKNTFSHIENIYVLDTEGPTPPTCKNIKFKKMIKYFPKQLDLEFSDVVLKYNN